jgi:small-conductance mechanosensitive channel
MTNTDIAITATTPSSAHERFDSILTAIAERTGAWANSEVLGHVTMLQLLLSLSILALTFVVVAVLHHFLHAPRGHRPTPPTEVDVAVESHTIRSLLEAVRPPLMLFVGGSGIWAALWVVLFRLETHQDYAWTLTTIAVLRQIAGYVALFWGLFRLVTVLERKLHQWTSRTSGKWDDILVRLGMRALRLVLPLLAFMIVIPTLGIPATYDSLLKQIVSLVMIGGVGFVLYQLTQTAEDAVVDEFRIDVKDNLAGRKIQTKVRVLKRILVMLIVVITVALMLMVFEPVRAVGKSLLASAGVAGIIIGFAAQRSLATLVAGIQIAFTQPIRIDDVVIVEGQWGRIEEITMTYVVVVIWDLRRLVVPITYFIEKPFENWTRVNANLLGTVMLYVDYTVDLDALRAELDRILERSKHWDRRVKVLQVTDVKERTLELRVLVSAADAPTAFDLRCEVREKLVVFLQRNYPQCLPRIRTEFHPVNGESHSPTAEPGHEGRLAAAS